MLNIKQNSKKGSDYLDLEIKTVPIMKNNNYKSIKEITYLSVIDVNNLTKYSFENSDLLKKLIKLYLFLLM